MSRYIVKIGRHQFDVIGSSTKAVYNQAALDYPEARSIIVLCVRQ